MVVCRTDLREDLRTAMEPKYRVLRHNVKVNLYNGIAWAIGFNLVMPFTGVLAARLGATNTDFALLSSIPAMMSIIATLPAAFMIEQFHKQKRITSGILLFSRISYLLLAMLPWFPGGQIRSLIYLVGFYTATSSIVGVTYQSLMGEIIPAQQRNKIFSQRNILSGAAGMVVTLFAGWGIDRIPYPYGYQLAFGLAFIAAIFETYYFFRLRIPSEEAIATRAPSPPVPLFEMILKKSLQFFRNLNVGASRSFYLFSISAVIYVFTWQAVWPVYLKVKVDILHASNTWISIDTVLGAIGSMLGFISWAKLADRFGNGLTVFVSALLLALSPFMWIYAPSMLIISAYDFFGGFVTAGFNQALFNRLLELAPSHARTRSIAVYTSLTQISAIIAPIVGMRIFELLPYWMSMGVFGIARIAGAFCFLLVITWLNIPRKKK